MVGLTVDSTWLRVWCRHPVRRLLVCAQALPYTEEGAFTMPLVVRYRTKQGQRREQILTLSGEIVSRVRASPERLFFGVLPYGNYVVTKRVEIRTKMHKGEPISVRVDPPFFSLSTQERNPGIWQVSVSFSPLRKGSVQSDLRAYSGGRLLCKVPLSAYVR